MSISPKDSINYIKINNLPKGTTLEINDTYKARDEGKFFVVTSNKFSQDVDECFDKALDPVTVQSPWKMHISVDRAQLDKAWEVVAPFLISKKVDNFKVVKLSAVEAVAALGEEVEIHLKESAERVSTGNQITIYMRNGAEGGYNQLKKEIENLLVENQIKPGRFDKSDKVVGQYTSVRASGVPMSETYNYQSAGDNYNPFPDLPDPFTSLLDEQQMELIDFTQNIDKAIEDIALQIQKLTEKNRDKWAKSEANQRPTHSAAFKQIKLLINALEQLGNLQTRVLENTYKKPAERTLDLRAEKKNLLTICNENIFNKTEFQDSRNFLRKLFDTVRGILTKADKNFYQPKTVNAVETLQRITAPVQSPDTLQAVPDTNKPDEPDEPEVYTPPSFT